MAVTLTDTGKLIGAMANNRATWYFLPSRWRTPRTMSRLVWSPPRRWDPKKRDDIPKKPGVYAFLLKPSFKVGPPGVYVLYVGMTENPGLRSRYADYASEATSPNGRIQIRRMFGNWSSHIWYTYALTKPGTALAIEKKLRMALIPPFNNDIDADIHAAKKAFA